MPSSLHSNAYLAFRTALVAMRKEVEVTQVELAERLGKPQQYISKIERGERRVDLVEFIAICRALRIDPKDAFASMLRRVPKAFDI